MNLEKEKDRVAKSKGYPNWKDFFDWVAREGENTFVVAQQIESAMEEVLIINSTVDFFKLKEGHHSGYYPNHKEGVIYPGNYIPKGRNTETRYYVAMYPQDWIKL